MKRLLQTALGVCWLLLVACGPDRRPEPPGLAAAASGWNLLLVTVDTVRADRLGAYGYERRTTSPNIDTLLASGVAFDRAMAPRALTWPSLGSVLTGLYPSGHGLIDNGYEFPDELLTLPKLLQAAGYQTGAVLSNMCQANHQGWGSFACGKGNDSRVNEKTREWMGTVDREKPFYFWAHYFGAHAPYYNGGRDAPRVADQSYRGPVAAKKGPLNRIMREGLDLSAADHEHLTALYDAAVMGTDRFVGELLDSLEQSGLLEKTLILFLADHGEDLYEHHGYLYHACSVYQSSLHVPLGFVAPGLLPAGARVAQPAELIDVLPTVLELLGVPAPSDLHGRSLVPLLERPGAGGAGKPAFSEYYDTEIRTVLAGDWKLVENPDEIFPECFAGVPQDFYPIAAVELYDLSQDPQETANLASRYPQRVEELRELIRRRFAGLSRNIRQQEVPEELKEELRALGYVAN
jgi:arylsulfatase A-like enzyme